MRDADAGAIDAVAHAKSAARSYAARVWGYRQGEAVAAMIYVGRVLGLFEAMAGEGAMTAEALAAKTGLHPRWLLEWMRLQAAAQILVYEPDDRFILPPEADDILGRPASRAYAGDSFVGGYPPEQLAGLIESFRTGIGKTYESDGPEGVVRSEARHIRTAEQQVVPTMIPALEGVQAKLATGAMVADVGCGDGALSVALARAYPRSTIHAMEPNSHAIAHVSALAQKHGLTNLHTFAAPAEKFPGDALYDLVITFDCIHDMTDPAAAMAEIRRRLRPDGTWFIKDIRSKPKFEDNLRNPMLAMMYSFSLFNCMSSAMSEPGGAGLGTLGFNPEVAERMVREAGFTRFRMLDFKDPGNLYYEVRP